MNKNKMKKILILSAAACMAFTGGIATMTYAKADDTPVFDRLGASIKYKESENSEENGIRFGMYANAKMYKQFVAGTTESGMIIIPTDLLNGGLTLDNLDSDAMKVVTFGMEENQENVEIGAWKLNEVTGNYESYVYVKGMPSTSYNRAMTAVGYLDVDGVGTGEATVYTEATNLSVADVAIEVQKLLDQQYANDKENETYVEKSAELANYLNEYRVTFVDAYGNKNVLNKKYGDSFADNIPMVEEREGFEFLGWAERNGATSYADPVDEIENTTVKSNREFVAKFEAVGPTYEKPALAKDALISEAEYSFVQYGREEDYPTSYSVESSAAVFDGVGISDWKDMDNTNTNTKFVVSATLKGGWTATYVGFVFSTQEGYDLQVVLDKENGIVVQSKGKVFGDHGVWRQYLGKAETQAMYNPEEDTDVAIEFDGLKNFIVYINGKKAVTINLRFNNHGDSADNRHYLAWGNGDTLKIGLNATNGYAIFTDWGYTTDESRFNEQAGVPVQFNQWIEGAEVAKWKSDVSNSANWPNGGPGQNTAFEVTATVAAGSKAMQTGFVLTTDKVNSLQIMYNAETGRVRVTNGELYREYSITAGLYKAGEENTFTLKYDGSVWIKFLINGTSAITNGWETDNIHLRWGYDGDNSSGVGTTKAWQSLGSGNTLYVGLTAIGSANFTSWNFTAEAGNESAWESVVNGTFTQDSETQVTIQNGAYLIPEAEVANWNNGNAGNVTASGENWQNGGKQMNTKFSVSTTIQANASENYKVGFVFTLNGTDYFTVVYNNEEKEIRVQASDGKYRDYGLGDTFNPAGTTMTIKYDGVQGLYIYFGEKIIDLKNAWGLSEGPAVIFRFGYTPAADGGKGNNEHITTALKESNGTLKVGLVVMDGTATFTNTSFNLN